MKEILANMMVQLRETVLAWATIWPLLYVFAPKVLNKDYSTWLLSNFGAIYVGSLCIVILVFIYHLRFVWLRSIHRFIAHAHPGGEVYKYGTNVAIDISKADSYKRTASGMLILAKHLIVIYLGLHIFVEGVEKNLRDFQVETQQIQINTLQSQVKQLRSPKMLAALAIQRGVCSADMFELSQADPGSIDSSTNH